MDEKPYKCPNHKKDFNWTDNQPWDKNVLKPGLISSIHHQLFTSFLLCLLQAPSRFSPPLRPSAASPLSTDPNPSFLSVTRNGDGEGENCHFCPHHVHLHLWLLRQSRGCFPFFSCNDINRGNYSLLPPSFKLPVRERIIIFFATTTSQVTSLLPGYY